VVRIISRKGLALAGAAVASAAVLGLGPLSGVADAQPFMLCNVNQNTWVRDAPGGNVLYTIPAGGGWRWDSTVPDWSYGHGNQAPQGYIPNDGRIYNCHSTTP
jgi:hypothetical protein